MENPNVQQVLEKQLLTVAQAVEEKLDDEIATLDRLEIDDIEVLREKRIQQMKKMAEKRSHWISLGHGEYSEIPSEKEFFSVVKASQRVVCHFYRENWPCKEHMLMARVLYLLADAGGSETEQLLGINSLPNYDRVDICLVMDKHLSALAKQHIETRFVKIHAEKSPFLAEKLKIVVLPTLALIKNTKVDNYLVGFDELGGRDDFSTEELEERLARYEAIIFEGESSVKAARSKGHTRSVRQSESHDSSDSD